MIRPTGTEAISRRHSSRESCRGTALSEYMYRRMPRCERWGQGTRSLPAGTSVIAGALMLVAEDADGVGGGLSAALHAQLGEQGRHVVLHRLLGQEHPLADLPVGQPFPDELQDLALLGGQAGTRTRLARLVPKPRHQLAGRPRVQHRLARGHRTYRADQVGAADLLEHVA